MKHLEVTGAVRHYSVRWASKGLSEFKDSTVDQIETGHTIPTTFISSFAQ